jgi:hypothetical protein
MLYEVNCHPEKHKNTRITLTLKLTFRSSLFHRISWAGPKKTTKYVTFAGSYVDVPNSYWHACCLNRSLLECLPPAAEARVQFSAEICQLSRTSSLGWRWPLSTLSKIVTLTWSVLFDSEYADLQGWTTRKCYSAYILVQLICFHVCSWNHIHWG